MVDYHHLGRSFAPHPIKGHKTLQILVCVCVCVVLGYKGLFLLWCCDATYAVLTSCLRLNLPFKRLQVLQLSSIWCQFTLQRRCIYTRCVYVHMFRYVPACLYIFCGCLHIRCFCWCLHIAAPKRGRLFHLIEGQYLHEHSYKQLSQLGPDRTQATTVLQ